MLTQISLKNTDQMESKEVLIDFERVYKCIVQRKRGNYLIRLYQDQGNMEEIKFSNLPDLETFYIKYIGNLIEVLEDEDTSMDEVVNEKTEEETSSV